MVGMSTRNLVWLAAVVTAGVVVGIAAGWVWGLVAGAVVLGVSEVVQRTARRKRQAAAGVEIPSPLRRALTNRRRPGA